MMKTVTEWSSYIDTLHPETISLGLDRITQVKKQLNLTFDCPVITVAGTNGKGSCVKLLEAILSYSGYRVGAYTSPHLLRFNERIRVNNNEVDDATLCQAFAEVEQARGQTPLTFFEYTTLAALLIFKNIPLDALILEVGLGGRLDAVNCIDADIALITSIDLDHTHYLGETREAISAEKAGIFRPNQIVICGDLAPPKQLLLKAKEFNTEFYCAGEHFEYQIAKDHWSWQSKQAQFDCLPIPNLAIKNVATALMAITLAQQKYFNIPTSVIAETIKKVKLFGRFQEISKPVPCILDVAHNPAASELLAERISQQHQPKQLIAIVGMLKDKDIMNTLKPLHPWVHSWHLGSLSVPRGANSAELARHLQAFENAEWYTYEHISDAFRTVSNTLNSNNKILVFGSFYTVAEVLNLVLPSSVIN